MSDKRIKIYAIHPEIDNVDKAAKWLRITDLELLKNFVWDDKEPDYIIATDRLYVIPECAKKFLELVSCNPGSIRIFWAGEAVLPDFNIFDYAITPNYNFSFMDRSARRVYKLLTYEIHQEINDLTLDEAKTLITGKKRFCNFLYSNGMAAPYRDKLFHAVSEYKRVDSLGPYLNNVNTLITLGGGGGYEK